MKFFLICFKKISKEGDKTAKMVRDSRALDLPQLRSQTHSSMLHFTWVTRVHKNQIEHLFPIKRTLEGDKMQKRTAVGAKSNQFLLHQLPDQLHPHHSKCVTQILFYSSVFVLVFIPPPKVTASQEQADWSSIGTEVKNIRKTNFIQSAF